MTNLARQICNNFWQQTLLIVFAGLSSFAFAKEPLSAIVDIKGVKLEQQLLAHYQKVLTKALQQDVRVAQKSILSARAFDILITDNTSLMPSWYQPVYVLDTLPAFNRITLAEQSGEVKLSAAVKRPFVLSTIKHTYPAEDAGTAVRLLKSNKVDAIVDYVKNNSFYRSIGQKLDFTVLSEQTNIIVKFKDGELENAFSQSSVDLANLKHFDNELTAEILPSGNHIDWFLVGKSIN